MEKNSAERAAYEASKKEFRARIAAGTGRAAQAHEDAGKVFPWNKTVVTPSSAGVDEPAREGFAHAGEDVAGSGAGFAHVDGGAALTDGGEPPRYKAAPTGAHLRRDDSRVEAILAGLNPQQRDAVVYEDGPLLVVAGAGSGKTRVLTSRIAYLIATGRATPGQILAITFTNKAAKEMRERLEGMLGGVSRMMWISTFHSACVRILRAEHSVLGMRSTFTIYDQQDSQRLMSMVCREENIDIRANPPKTLSRKVSDLKNDLVTPAQAAQAAHDRDSEVLAQAYAAYQRRLGEANAMDFDDLIMTTVTMLRANPDLAEHYRRRFRYILVDEYQDTNQAQYELVRILTGDPKDPIHGELTVVGDADQSIYAFRGATIRNIEDFEEDFPNATSILLEQNYRSTQSILSAANAIISHNPGRRAKRLWTDHGDGEKIVGYVADSEADESAFVVEEIDRLMDGGEATYGDVAVFYRTNAQSRAIEDMFVRSGIPYRVIGGTRFYERREIKDALAYLHAINNPDDTVSIRRVLNMPKRGLGDKAEETVANHAARWGVSFGAALADVAKPAPERGPVEGLTARAHASMTAFVEMLAVARAMAEAGEAPAAILDEIMDSSGYLEMLRASNDPQDESRLENLAELHSVAMEFRTQNPEATLAEWLDQISLVSDSDQLGDASSGEVTLMTVHTAKGLEFPVVFVTGLEDGTFPHMRSLAESKELAEERRLAYVAVTRARRRLYITRAATRSAWGAPQEFPPSRFIDEIPRELIDWRREESSADILRGSGWSGGYGSGASGYGSGSGGYGSRSYGKGGGRGYSPRGYSSHADDDGPVFGSGKGFVPGKLGVDTGRQDDVPTTSPSADETKGLAVGDSVRHKSFGTGTIIAFEGKGKNVTAKVKFSSGQTKRLALRFAPLEKM